MEKQTNDCCNLSLLSSETASLSMNIIYQQLMSPIPSILFPNMPIASDDLQFSLEFSFNWYSDSSPASWIFFSADFGCIISSYHGFFILFPFLSGSEILTSFGNAYIFLKHLWILLYVRFFHYGQSALQPMED